MMAPIATFLRYLSSLPLSLSIALVPPANDPVEDALQATVNFWSHRVTLATVLVAIGVAMEAIELVHAGVEYLKRHMRLRHERTQLTELREIVPLNEIVPRGKVHEATEPTWVKVFLRVGVMLVAIGVIGEWRYGERLNESQNAVHKYDLAKLTEADQKAGGAAKSAQDAYDLGTDLLGKYKVDEREIVELKAVKLPRRLSSAQKEIVRLAVTSFEGRSFNISCATPGGDPKEPLDFEMDFVDALGRKNVPRVRKVPVTVGYLITCDTLLTGGTHIPPLQVEAGVDRQDDAEILVKALVGIGISKKQITRKPNANKEILSLTIGPKLP
jgi:hypothetical protein